jgi:hypothetical protein
MNSNRAILVFKIILYVACVSVFGCAESQDKAKNHVATTDKGYFVNWTFSAGKITTIRLSDQRTNGLVEIIVIGDYASKHSVSISGSNTNIELAKTDFAGLNEVTSWTSSFVSFTQSTRNDSSGRFITRRWWHHDGYLLLEETFLLSRSGKVKATLVKGPFGIEIKK